MPNTKLLTFFLCVLCVFCGFLIVDMIHWTIRNESAVSASNESSTNEIYVCTLE